MGAQNDFFEAAFYAHAYKRGNAPRQCFVNAEGGLLPAA
jgi:hypothetical protein